MRVRKRSTPSFGVAPSHAQRQQELAAGVERLWWHFIFFEHTGVELRDSSGTNSLSLPHELSA